MTASEQQKLADFLNHISESIVQIESYVEDMDEMDFLANRLVQDAVIRNLEIIGEASHNIETKYPDFAAAHPELPLAVAYQMRNAIAHGYFKVDLEVVWKTLHNDLPELYKLVKAISG
jgi:uncharacterized protein with HEPN domain